MILKIQRPLGGDMTVCLVYNKDRTVMGHWPYTPDLAKLFGDEPRLYVNGSISQSEQLIVHSVIGHKKMF